MRPRLPKILKCLLRIKIQKVSAERMGCQAMRWHLEFGNKSVLVIELVHIKWTSNGAVQFSTVK